jgi:2,3-bisphosphoglycerate-independent phosphoglycerate mutase
MSATKTVLLILDGWGLGPVPASDAIAQADTPYVDSLLAQYPHTTLTTFGEAVGLPDGQMGNSEVGHLNIGAGRIVWQELARINKAVRERTLHTHPVLIDAIEHAKKHGKALHLMGLVSDGGVHSHITHLLALCDMATEAGLTEVYIHAFTDGRDCDPKSGAGFIDEVVQHIEHQPVQLATVIGRYYAMDRDKRWERVKLAYDLLVFGQGEPVADFAATMRQSYTQNVTDEFLPALRNADLKADEGRIKGGDVVICFNFRTDRCREITEVLTQQNMPEHEMTTLELYYVTMTRYDERFRDVKVVYEKDDIALTIGEVLQNAGKTQVRIAETEKYPHVTFFFSGGREAEFEGERRLMVPSPKVATYDLQPEMSAPEITETIMADILTNAPDFICLNYANADMVGHTGDFKAAMVAAQTVDHCLSKLVPLALEHGYQCILIADHGNSDYMINPDGTPNTAHTVNPVPCILVSNDVAGRTLQPGSLADVAPTILDLMGVEKPDVMTGQSLIKN